MFKVDHIAIKLGDVKRIESDVFTIDNGLWALVGRNGAGKSTFLASLIGDRMVDGGKVFWKDRLVSDLSIAEKSKLISVVYTKPEVFGKYTVKDVIGLGRLPYQNTFGLFSEADRIAVDRAISILKLEPFTDHLFSTLSDGEKQLVMIGRALAQDTPCILLDEPSAFLDVVNRRRIVRTLHEVTKETGKLIVFSTHDVDMVATHCDGLIWIANGKIDHSTEPSEFKLEIKTLFDHEV